MRTECKLAVASFGIVELSENGNILQEYRWVNFKKIGSDEKDQAVFFEYSGRIKIFYVADLSMFLSGCTTQLNQIGISKVKLIPGQSLIEVVRKRAATYANTGAAVSVFNVNKKTSRSSRLIPRQLHITELYIVEKDVSGFQYVSFQKLEWVYAVVRSWSDPRMFTIEYIDGTSRVYHCSVRDTVLALLQDVTHAAGNVKVIITGELSDSLRLIPRFAEEQYESRILDSIFGPFSIEVWFLRQLSKACKKMPPENAEIIQICRELNANVPFPGIAVGSDKDLVKTCLTGVLRCIHSHISTSGSKFIVNDPRGMGVMLQTVYRMLPSATGYKTLVEMKELDPRHILVALIKCDVDFINYWAIQVLRFVCSCPLESRNVQQEYVNKHTLLTDALMKGLLDLMGVRIEEPLLMEEEEEDNENGEGNDMNENVSEEAEEDSSVNEVENTERPPEKKKVVSKPTTTTNSTSEVETKQPRTPWENTPKPVEQEPETVDRDAEEKEKEKTVTDFFPNSLVIVGSAELLESIVCSRRDTSSPEMLNKVLDLLAERYEILIHMLRSTSFLIMENAAILMHVLIKNRPEIGPLLQEAALSDCLVLKHFYNGVFSPSASQRFISRFLCATWMSGTDTTPGKKLLKRLLPSGLLEYLKLPPISAEHRENLDIMEDDFYATYAGSLHGGNANADREAGRPVRQEVPGGDLQTRMRTRISKALKGAAVSKNSTESNDPPQPPPTPENFRIMFHVMTQDHQLPDLVWNEQTRLELRSTLEGEISEFEREQRLRGHKKIAWNYQQFYVKFESLKYMLQVGPIYIHHFLEAGDSFIRTLENPSHGILFEKLVRRVLGNVERDPRLATLCVRCLCKLYDVCSDIVGTFDDTMIVVRMLEEAKDMELNHYVLDFLVILSKKEDNLEQLLDREFIDLMLKYASLSHLNPDQIGNALARATGKSLMIEDAPAGSEGYSRSAAAVAHDAESNMSDEEKIRKQKRSIWVPEDDACPRTWFTAPKGRVPPPVSVQRGPFKVSQLLSMVENDEIDGSTLFAPGMADVEDSESFESEVDTGKWNPLSLFFQLRIQVLSPGKAIYSPAEVGTKAITLLYNLSALHKSANTQGAPFYPTPISKRLMSQPEHMSVFAQLLLCNDRHVVHTAAKLLKSLVEHNLLACSKLYLTGAFYFGCRYAGNDFQAIAELFAVSHLLQSHHDSASSVARNLLIPQRSVLGTIVTPALVNILHRHGPTMFSNVFTGSYDNPEVIWSPEHRTQVVEMINNHLGDFPARLRQYTMCQYDYIPMPKIKFVDLDRELYCQEYYLRNLCDEIRFPNWPIRDPLMLLRETIERWREELSKGIADSGERAALEVFGLKGKFNHMELRKAYKNLARKYHPDKNPNGREMFEKIQAAYELLTSIEIKSNETDLRNVVVIMRTQNIIYRRFPDTIKSQKYPAYPMLLQVLPIPSTEDAPEETDAALLDAGVKLMYYTTSVSPLNAKEFVRAGVLPKLHDMIVYALEAYNTSHSKSVAETILTFGMKTLASVAQFDVGRSAMFERCPILAENMYTIIALEKKLPIAAENCIEAIARGAEDGDLQQALVHAGVIWRLIPLMLTFDSTLDDDISDETQREKHGQRSYNLHAVLAAKALGRLGGYMFDELASPNNPKVKNAMARLLTVPLAKLLRNRRPRELLCSLNENVEKPTKIWNIGMRKEILDFVRSVDQERPPGSNEDDLAPANDFIFSNLRNELCVGGVYVRIYIKNGDSSDIDDPSQFCRELITYIWESVGTAIGFNIPMSEYLRQCAEALRFLAVAHDYIPYDIAKADKGLEVTLKLLDSPEDSEVFDSSVQLMSVMGGVPDVVTAYAKKDPPCMWKIIRTLAVKGSSPVIKHLWKCAEGMASVPDGLDGLIQAGSIAHMLGIIFNAPGHQGGFQNRLAAVSFLSKFLWNPVKGTEASNYLRRFLPEPVVLLMRSKASNMSLQLLDDVCENPELIWTAEMQGEIRSALTSLFSRTLVPSSESGSTEQEQDFSKGIEVGPDYTVPYRQLKNEIYIGGVYIRLYLKQPTFRLTNPIFFLEKLVAFWESSFDAQVPPGDVSTSVAHADDTCQALVLGKEDFLSLLTSCVVCVIKGEGSVVDHLLSWGFTHKLFELLQRAVDKGRVGVPVVSVVRLLHELADRAAAVDSIAGAPVDPMRVLVRSLNISGDPSKVELPKEATVIVELLKKIFQCMAAQCLPEFVGMAMRAKLPMFLLDNVVGATKDQLAHVRNASALRVHAVDVLKAMILVDSPDAPVLQAMLDAHSSWQEYKHQSHDLFITDHEKTDHFLIEDSHDKVFMALITDGSASGSEGLPAAFTSTGTNFSSNYSDTPLSQTTTPPVPSEPKPVSNAAKQQRSNSYTSHLPAQAKQEAIPAATHRQRSSSTTKPAVSGPQIVTTSVTKGQHGIGLDLTKSADGRAHIQRFKEMPAGVVNPAAQCNPPIKPGDIIVGVNGKSCSTFAEVIKTIRGLEGAVVTLQLERSE
eukprot:CAMPEP_0185040382 /NCGR_PEP_ID=MMETSP1103-20130426/38364_1 /TAXON_ID=36769 /ORGANISM="Paraphysomonas bandaiensis, Strain Caron Lab Isolate" /LENGTH=2494 /DNA_ID=CAMNT_0027579655 /DNA_START=336 /DNA_END=7820 /DNA_ORIENTATION=+